MPWALCSPLGIDPGVGEGGPVVVPLVRVVSEEVGPDVCVPVRMEVMAEG